MYIDVLCNRRVSKPVGERVRKHVAMVVVCFLGDVKLFGE